MSDGVTGIERPVAEFDKIVDELLYEIWWEAIGGIVSRNQKPVSRARTGWSW